MSNGDKEQVIILGSGCAGLTAAVYAARANLNPLVIQGPLPGGQLTTTSEVENFPGFPEGIGGYELTDLIKKQAERFGTRFAFDWIEQVHLEAGDKVLTTGDGKTYRTQTLIVATGASPRMLGVPGEKDYFGGKGVTTCATCDGAFYRGETVTVVGGGDSACEEALFLTRFCTKVTLIHRRDELRASKIMAQRVLENDKIEVLWDTVVDSVNGDNDKVTGVSLSNTKTGGKSSLPCAAVFIAIGHIPNTKLVKDLVDLDDEGYIISTSHNNVDTGVEGIYTAGDCSDKWYRQAITASGMGCRAAMEAERWLASQPTHTETLSK